MQVSFSKTATKDLRKLPKKDALALIDKLETYAKTGAGDVKKLTGRSEYRLRHGNYRALFEIENGVLVVRVAHRREVY